MLGFVFGERWRRRRRFCCCWSRKRMRRRARHWCCGWRRGRRGGWKRQRIVIRLRSCCEVFRFARMWCGRGYRCRRSVWLTFEKEHSQNWLCHWAEFLRRRRFGDSDDGYGRRLEASATWYAGGFGFLWDLLAFILRIFWYRRGCAGGGRWGRGARRLVQGRRGSG